MTRNDLDYSADGMVRVNRFGTGRDLAEVEMCARRALQEELITAVDGTEISVRTESFCVQSHTPNEPRVACLLRRVVKER